MPPTIYIAMSRYLIEYYIRGAISRGQEVCQFLGGFVHDGQPALRYLIIRAESDGIVLSMYECEDPQDEAWHDITSFGELDGAEPGESAAEHHCATLDEALALATVEYGGRADRWVNQGVLDDEYSDYVRGGHS
jgi:hypothetical protein